MHRFRSRISSIQSGRKVAARSSDGVNQVQAAIATSSIRKRREKGRQESNRYRALPATLNGRSK